MNKMKKKRPKNGCGAWCKVRKANFYHHFSNNYSNHPNIQNRRYPPKYAKLTDLYMRHQLTSVTVHWKARVTDSMNTKLKKKLTKRKVQPCVHINPRSKSNEKYM